MIAAFLTGGESLEAIMERFGTLSQKPVVEVAAPCYNRQ